MLTVKYKSADKTDEKKVIVPPETPIVAYAPADRSELKPGAQIIIFPGVRRERHAEAPKPQRRKSRPKRDRLELPD